MLKLVEIVDNRFVYRCDYCGWESPEMSKKQAHTLPPPAHACKKSREDVNRAAFRIVREATEKT
jgi:hypothetical protein